MNLFHFNSHEPRYPYVFVALLSGIAGAFLILLAVRFTGLGAALTVPQEILPFHTPETIKSITVNNYEKNTIAVVERVSPSVVMISTNTVVESFDFFTGPELRNVQSLGSGVVFRKDGYILTNNHVINNETGSTAKISVILFTKKYSSGKAYPAKIVGADPQTDLAVLRISNRELSTLDWGNSDNVKSGQTAIAIGNPLSSDLKTTVTLGVISSKMRNLKDESGIMRNMLQTDASINPGNSGGPLLDSNGEVIGINTAVIANSQGIGFAIPSNTAKTIAEQLIAKGYVARPGLGISYFHFTPDNVGVLEDRIGRQLPVDTGLLVARVLKNTPAEKAGLQPGDIIVKINGKRVKDVNLLQTIVAESSIGSKVKLEFYRRYKLQKVEIKIGELKGQ